MKMITFLIIACIAKTTINAQPRMTVSYNNARLKDVLEDLCFKSRVGYFCSAKYLRLSLPVTYKAKNIPVDSLLKHIFSDQPFLEYKVVNNIIAILPRSIKGKVTDMQGKPIKDVIVYGDSQTTQTDDNGTFTLNRASCDSVINFSHREYLKVVITPPSRYITVRLKGRS